MWGMDEALLFDTALQKEVAERSVPARLLLLLQALHICRVCELFTGAILFGVTVWRPRVISKPWLQTAGICHAPCQYDNHSAASRHLLQSLNFSTGFGMQSAS